MKTPKEREEEEYAPLYVFLTTYFGYAVLIIFGHIRDFFGKRFRPENYKHLREQNVRAASSPGGVCLRLLLTRPVSPRLAPTPSCAASTGLRAAVQRL